MSDQVSTINDTLDKAITQTSNGNIEWKLYDNYLERAASQNDFQVSYYAVLKAPLGGPTHHIQLDMFRDLNRGDVFLIGASIGVFDGYWVKNLFSTRHLKQMNEREGLIEKICRLFDLVCRKYIRKREPEQDVPDDNHADSKRESQHIPEGDLSDVINRVLMYLVCVTKCVDTIPRVWNELVHDPINMYPERRVYRHIDSDAFEYTLAVQSNIDDTYDICLHVARDGVKFRILHYSECDLRRYAEKQGAVDQTDRRWMLYDLIKDIEKNINYRQTELLNKITTKWTK